MRATGKPVEAEAAYRTAIRLNPDHIDAYTNLGILLNGLKRNEEAAACYCKVITLRPKHREARKLLALAHCTLGEVGEAVRILEEWLDEEPADPIALHMRSACTGRDVPARASNGFVERTFDSFAASFESKLEKLSYRAPALVAAMLEGSNLEPSERLEVLDAGCGTGLCGSLVAPYARRLIGVDLSEGMLALAKEKHVYDVLVKAELTEYLRGNSEAFDLIVSADTLVYFGDLEGVLGAAAGALRPMGSWCSRSSTRPEARPTSITAGVARPVQSLPCLRGTFARPLGAAAGDRPRRIAHGGRCAGRGVGDSSGEVSLILHGESETSAAPRVSHPHLLALRRAISFIVKQSLGLSARDA